VGRETLEQMVRAGERATASDAAREERIANYEQEFSDGFVSSWAEGLTARKGQMAAALLANGGKSYFHRVELVDAESGEKIESAKLIDGAYGPVWLMTGAADERRYGKFITAHAKREATMVKKGVRERVVIFEAEATVELWSPSGARGLSGATQVTVIVRPADRSVVYTGRAGTTREDAEAWVEQQSVAGEFYAWQEKVIA
jgi:hypothetical protein